MTPAQRLLEAIGEAAERRERVPCVADPDVWFSDSRSKLTQAVLACVACPLVVPCAQAADALGERWGVWGGVNRQLGGKS